MLIVVRIITQYPNENISELGLHQVNFSCHFALTCDNYNVSKVFRSLSDDSPEWSFRSLRQAEGTRGEKSCGIGNI